MAVVRSYIAGHWFAPDSGTPVYDAATGELVAEVSAEGADFGAALAFGRSVGGPALRELTFHQRAELAKEAGQLLRKHRDELYELSYRTGATLSDSKFDIDGGIGVLLSYASKAKRELPNDRFAVEAARGRGAGQRLQLPRLGSP
jgi:oxepin-CoA hydrolase/3-oxo-5,6-dehydrosuberyl-CoA semialdehyde dehydrogenase